MEHCSSKAARRFALAAACFALGFCVLFGALSRLLNDKMSLKYTATFYSDVAADRSAYDLLFFGSSHIFNGLLPLTLYEQTGIFSYNLGMTNEYPAVTYWRLRDALNRSDPQVVVIDVYRALAAEKMPKTENDLGLLHNSLDGMPLSLLKARAVADILDAAPLDFDGVFNYLFPLAQFHSRYDSLTEDDFHPYRLESRGAMPLRALTSGAPAAADRRAGPAWRYGWGRIPAPHAQSLRAGRRRRCAACPALPGHRRGNGPAARRRRHCGRLPERRLPQPARRRRCGPCD